MNKRTKAVFYIASPALFAFFFFFAFINEAHASANHTMTLTAATVPCTKTGNSCVPTGNASVGTATFEYIVDISGTDTVGTTLWLEFGTNVSTGVNEATTVVPENACGPGETVVLQSDDPGLVDNTTSCGNPVPVWNDTTKQFDWDSLTTTCTAGDSIEITWKIEFCDDAAGNTYDIFTDCSNVGGDVKCDTTPDYIDAWTVDAGAVSAIEQVAYKWFGNTDSAGVGPSATQNTLAIAPPTGGPFRLRVLLHVSDAELGISGTTSALQFAERGADGVCGNDFTADTDETYSDVSSTTGAIQFFNNASVSDGDTLLANIRDPQHASTTAGIGSDNVVEQVYSEGAFNLLTNSVNAVPQDEDALYDFALVDNSAPANTHYCLKMVQFEGGDFTGGTTGYGTSSIATLRTAQRIKVRLKGVVRLRHVRLR